MFHKVGCQINRNNIENFRRLGKKSSSVKKVSWQKDGVWNFWDKSPWWHHFSSKILKNFYQNKILELVTRDFYLDLNSQVSNKRFLSWFYFSS